MRCAQPFLCMIGTSGPRVPAHQVTTRNLGAAYPFIAEAGLGQRGVVIGDDLLGGSFVFDPFELYAQGVVSNPNMVVFGQIGRGKSAFVKTFLWRQAVFGRRAWVVDPKGEYGDLAAAWGVRPVALRPGGAIRLNPLDPGPEHAAVSLDGRGQHGPAPDGAAGLAGQCLPRAQPLAPRAGRAGRGADHGGRARPTVPTVPAVVDALLAPTAEAAASLRTELRDLLEDGRDVALELRRLVHGDLRGMFDGPTTPGLDLSAPLVVLDLSALYTSTALGVLMACATAWLQAALARTASVPGGREPGVPGGRRGLGDPVQPRGGPLAPVVVEAVARLRGVQRGRAAPGLGSALGRRVGLRAGGAGPGAAGRLRDRVVYAQSPGRAGGGVRAALPLRRPRPSCCPSSGGAWRCGRWVSGPSWSSTGSAPWSGAGGHRRRHDGRRRS